MTAPVIEPEALPDEQPEGAPDSGVPEGAVPIRLPVMAIEGYDTADGRHLTVGGISHRALPLTIYAQMRTPDGDRPHGAAHIVGAVTEMTRTPGPQVTSKTTGEPFPEGTFVWAGKGWMYTDVPAGNPAYRLVRDRALSGNSVDLSDIDGEVEYAEDEDPADPDVQPSRVRMSGVIGATTLVGLPAFPDAYVEIDGELMVPEGGQVITASAVSWRSSELADNCAPCQLGLAEEPADPEVDDEPPAEKPRHTGGMIALVPAEPSALAVDGGDPAEELHLTLAYLGDDVTGWAPEQRDAVHQVARMLADGNTLVEGEPGAPTDVFDTSFTGPFTASVFAYGVFNPDGGPERDKDPATVYLFGDGAELIHNVRDSALTALEGGQLAQALPEQHRPFQPHVTAGYGLDVGALTFTGPVEFDRVRVALGDDVTDYPLGGGAVVAAGAPVVQSAFFDRPEADGPTPLTILDDGSVFGHLATWDTCHIGFQGRCLTPPRSATGYSYFHTGVVRTELGDRPVGQLTLGRAGHAELASSARAAAEHYDRTGTAFADVVARDGRHGIWLSGVLRPGLTAAQLAQARAAAPSGDWRTVRGNLELVASLQVNVPGYPVPRARVASGVPVALVAAGVVPPAAERSWGLSRAELRAASGLDGDTASGPTVMAELLAEFAPLIEHARALQLERAFDVLDEALADAQYDPHRVTFAAEVDILLATEGEALANWVEKSGGLPPYIKRIAEHVQEGGADESRAIATAVNAAKRMCATGDTSLPGVQNVNAGSRAEACAAVADWEAKKASSK